MPGWSCYLRIPNEELKKFYQSVIRYWFEKTIHVSQYNMLLDSLVQGGITSFSLIFQEFFLSFISVLDLSSGEPEKIYPAFVLGMLIGLKDHYEIRSNRESGYGRYDVLLISKNKKNLAIIMEFKRVSRFEKIELELATLSALQQIEERHYAQKLLDRGVDLILYLGLGFKKKKCFDSA